MKKTDERFWDIRTQEHRLRNGEVTWQQLDAYLKARPDVSDKSQLFKPFFDEIEGESNSSSDTPTLT